MPKHYIDTRPVCTCGAYAFPHKLGGGKCDGSTFAEHQYYYVRSECEYCNCNTGYQCDVITGQEAIAHGDCYQEAVRNGGGVVDIEYTPPEEVEEASNRSYYTNILCSVALTASLTACGSEDGYEAAVDHSVRIAFSQGYNCSTSGRTFTECNSLLEHYLTTGEIPDG